MSPLSGHFPIISLYVCMFVFWGPLGHLSNSFSIVSCGSSLLSPRFWLSPRVKGPGYAGEGAGLRRSATCK